MNDSGANRYRGRLAPSPTGYLHAGHARTFWIAQERARKRGGILILRNDDLDRSRCRSEFVEAFLQDLKWLGLKWSEGPDCGGEYGPYSQSERIGLYRGAFDRLRADGHVYPCVCSRKDVQNAVRAPHPGEDEPVYPGTCRARGHEQGSGRQTHWRFRTRDGEAVVFVDGHYGRQEFVAGRDFGDFVVWRSDDLPSYQLAAVVDDAAMRISEVVRGADLLRSTARQWLIYRALGFAPPDFYHCPLMVDSNGARLAKRDASLNLRGLREQGATPEMIREGWSGRDVFQLPDVV